MLDLDYKNQSNDYILDMFFGLEDDGLYIAIQYKDGTVSTVPFNIRNYNVITARLERQYKEFITSFPMHKMIRFVDELFKGFLKLFCFLAINDLCYGDNKILNYCFLIFTGLILNLSTLIRGKNFASLVYKENNNVKAIDKYLKNKEKFLINLPNGDSFYGVNIANINSSEKSDPIDYMQNEEIKGQIKALMLSYKEE